MNYFVGLNLGATLTGIEKAQINRLHLFEEGGLSAKCIYTSFNTRLHENAKSFGVEGRCFSLYDFFQESEDYEETKRDNWLDYWGNQCGFLIKHVPKSNDIRVYDKNDLFLMYVHFSDNTYSNLVYINYFDENRKKIKREFYDSRGFLSKVNLLQKDQTIYAELFFDKYGKVKLEKYYHLENKEQQLTKIILKNYQHRDYFFVNEMELQTFFFDELYQKGDLYFCDKNKFLAEPLSKTSKQVPVCSVFHSTHALGQDDVLNSAIKTHYRFVLNHPKKFQRIIVSTKKQKQDLLDRYTTELPEVTVIPVGYTENHSINIEKKQKNKIIGVARYSPEKQIPHQIEVMSRLVTEFPDVELHLFGFGSVEKEMRELIEKYQLHQNVFIRGFAIDLFAEYSSSSLSLLTSKIEGFSLAVLEAQGFSVPVISYDIRYGPGEMIEDGVNGFLVEPNNKEMLYDKMREFLKDELLQKQFMIESEKNAARYNKEIIIQKWQDLVSDLHAELK